jgi:hypothetical protein
LPSPPDFIREEQDGERGQHDRPQDKHGPTDQRIHHFTRFFRAGLARAAGSFFASAASSFRTPDGFTRSAAASACSGVSGAREASSRFARQVV